MGRVKIDLKSLSLEELKKVLSNVEESFAKCGTQTCAECYADSSNFKGIGIGCTSIRGSLRIIIDVLEKSEQKEPKKDSEKPKYSGKCERCKNIDKEFFEKSGYRFCNHWHNFTVRDGFCYAFEDEKSCENCG